MDKTSPMMGGDDMAFINGVVFDCADIDPRNQAGLMESSLST
jgi:hypothetical protein